MININKIVNKLQRVFESLYYRSRLWKLKFKIIEHLENIGFIQRVIKFDGSYDYEYESNCYHNIRENCDYCEFYIEDECTYPSIEYSEITIKEFFRRCRLHYKGLMFFIRGIAKEFYYKIACRLSNLLRKLYYKYRDKLNKLKKKIRS